MSKIFTTEFQLGLWNAWLPFLFFMVFSMLFSFFLNKEGFKRGGNRSWLTKKESMITAISALSFYGILIIGIWIPLKTGTTLFYAGIVMYILCLILGIFVSISFVNAPMDKLITGGCYKFSRNPIYVVNILIVIAIILMSLSWIIVLLLAVYLVSNHFAILAEERFCSETYGNDFEEYKNKVRRYF